MYVCMYVCYIIVEEGFLVRGRLSARGGDGHAVVGLVGQGVLLLRGGRLALTRNKIFVRCMYVCIYVCVLIVYVIVYS